MNVAATVTGAAIGCAVATKWTALATMAVVGLDTLRALAAELRAALPAVRRSSSVAALRSFWRSFLARLVWLLLLPLAIYVLSCVVHLHLLPYSGAGDRFHDARFRCRLSLPESAGVEK